jgi:hypothetical protein
MWHLLEFDWTSPWVVVQVAHVAMTIWMLVDALRRGVDWIWFLIIAFFQPIGPWVYFFAVKFRELRMPRFGGSGIIRDRRRLSLDELRYHAERTPTVANRLALAERLMDKGQHREAIPPLEAILKMEAGYCTALHDLALCHLACGEPSAALPCLQKVIERDHRWSDYRAWRTLLTAQDALGLPDQALQTMRELAKMQPTLENTCRLAERMIDRGLKADAAGVLDQALTDHQFSPLAARWRNWRWAREARALLKEAEFAEPANK